MDRDDQVLLRPDDPVLALPTVKSVYARDAAGPELITVSTTSIFLLWRIGIGDLNRKRVAHEFRIEYLLVIPVTPAAVEHGKAQVVLRAGKSARLGIYLVGELEPNEMFRVDTDLVEQPVREVILHVLTGPLKDDRPEHAGSGRVVRETRARLISHRRPEIVADPVARHGGVVCHPVRHGHHMLDRDAFHHFGNIYFPLGDLVGKHIDHLLFECQCAFLSCDSDGCGRVALSEGVVGMNKLGAVGCPPAFGKDLAMSGSHETVHRGQVMVERMDAVAQLLAGYARLLRRTARQTVGRHQYFSFLLTK